MPSTVARHETEATLVALCEPLLALIVGYRQHRRRRRAAHQPPTPEEVAGFRRKFRQARDAAWTRVPNGLRGEFAQAEKLLVFTADGVMLDILANDCSTSAGGPEAHAAPAGVDYRQLWNPLLEYELFESANGGTTFFEIVLALTPGNDALREVAYLCLAAGFKGRYAGGAAGQSDDKLARIASHLLNGITRPLPNLNETDLCPDTYRHTPRRAHGLLGGNGDLTLIGVGAIAWFALLASAAGLAHKLLIDGLHEELGATIATHERRVDARLGNVPDASAATRFEFDAASKGGRDS